MYQFVTNNHATFYLQWKENCPTIKKSQNIMNMIVGSSSYFLKTSDTGAISFISCCFTSASSEDMVFYKFLGLYSNIIYLKK